MSNGTCQYRNKWPFLEVASEAEPPPSSVASALDIGQRRTYIRRTEEGGGDADEAVHASSRGCSLLFFSEV